MRWSRVEIPTVLKYSFLIHFITVAVFGVWFFFGTEVWVDLTGWPFYDPMAGRVLGAAFIGLAIGSLWGYRATSWEQVEVYVTALVVMGIFGSAGMVWMMLAHATIPIAGWLTTIIQIFLMVLFVYSYYVAKR